MTHPAAIDRPALIDLLDASLELELRELARATRSAVFRDLPDAAWVVGAVPGATVYRTRLSGNGADARIHELSAALELFGPTTWWAGPTATPSDLRDRLVAASYHLDDDEAGMAVDLEHLVENLPRPDNLAMLEMERRDGTLDDATLEGWLEVNQRTLGWSDEKRSVRRALYSDDDRRPRPWRHVLAVQEGRPVGACRVLVRDAVAMVHGVCTVPEARRQGIGSAVTLAGLDVARRGGARAGVLQASSMGEGPYRRIGFEVVARYGRYVREPAVTVGPATKTVAA